MYKIVFHSKIEKDLSKLPYDTSEKIIDFVYERLTRNPLLFGKPLRNSLKNFRSIRVSNYRIVYRIKGKDIFVLIVDHRRKVYKEAEKRI